MTTSTLSVRTWMVTAFLLGVVSVSSFAAEVVGESWYESIEPCKSCSDDTYGSACGACFNGLDVPSCGDMTPTAMLPGGQWYFQANFMAIRRQAGQNDVFQTRNQNVFTAETETIYNNTGDLVNTVTTLTRDLIVDPILSTDDLTFQNAAGYRLLLGWQLAENYAIEFSYFDLNDWDEMLAVSDATPYAETVEFDPTDPDTVIIDAYGDPVPDVISPYSLFSPFSGFGDPPIDAFDYNDLASIRYRSSLDNVELNVRHQIIARPSRLAVSVLWGGRHNAVREQFRYFTSSLAPAPGPGTNTVNIRTANDLWGAQVGAQFDFCWDPGWHTEFEIKGGVAHNRAVYEGDYDIQGSPAGGYQGRVDKGVTSWIGEMRLTLVYQFGQHLTTHLGYEALVLSRMALASSNFETDLSILGSPGAESWVLKNNGTVVYHGPSAGLTVAW